jgi:hypothetical protein
MTVASMGGGRKLIITRGIRGGGIGQGGERIFGKFDPAPLRKQLEVFTKIFDRAKPSRPHFMARDCRVRLIGREGEVVTGRMTPGRSGRSGGVPGPGPRRIRVTPGRMTGSCP